MTAWRRAARLTAGVGLGVAAGYAAYAGRSWLRYGACDRRARQRRTRDQKVGPGAAVGTEDGDALLDRFMPHYEIVERHRIEIEAPAGIVLAAAKAQELERVPVIRAIFRVRQLVMGGEVTGPALPSALLPQVLALGWGILAEIPDREVVVGAVTRPWQADVVFEAVAPSEFASFNEPDYVKIAWTLRAEPLESGRTLFSTETRAIATDAPARRKFRRYWTLVSPGVELIRWLLLRPLKAAAERAWADERGRIRPGALRAGEGSAPQPSAASTP